MKDNNKNELITYLPDFITGKLDDKEIESVIREEIEKNEFFKREYIKIKETLGYINSTEYELAPPNGYFNNLLPEIRKRIINDRISITDKLFNYKRLWKFAIPVIVIVLIFIVIIFSQKSKDNLNLITTTDTFLIKNKMSFNVDTNTVKTQTSIENKKESEKEYRKETEKSATKIKSYTIQKSRNKAETFIHNNDDFYNNEDIFDEIVILDIFNDTDIEQEFSEMDIQEQNIILDNLRKLKLN